MTLNEYIESLQEIVKENPENGDLLVIYSSDGEGNYFDTVYWSPTLGYYEDNEFQTSNEEDEDEISINSVCIN